MIAFDIILYYRGGVGNRMETDGSQNSLSSLTLGSVRNPVPKAGAVCDTEIYTGKGLLMIH